MSVSPLTPATETRETGGNVATFQPDWHAIALALKAPFAPEDVNFRISGNPKSPDKKAQVVAYVDARTVMQRLDDVLGIENWEYDFVPIVIEEIAKQSGVTKEMTKAKGILKIHGKIKCDLGTLSNTEASKGCASDAIKRAAVVWGVGRYLHEMGALYSEWGGELPRPYLNRDHIATLRSRLPKVSALSPSVARTVEMVEQGGFEVEEVQTAPRPSVRPTPQGAIAANPALSGNVSRASSLPRYPNDEMQEKFKPDASRLVYPEGFDPSNPHCLVCDGPMWDNRAKKRTGEFKETGADFTCKAADCKNDKGFKNGVWGKDPDQQSPAQGAQRRAAVATLPIEDLDSDMNRAMEADEDDAFGDD